MSHGYRTTHAYRRRCAPVYLEAESSGQYVILDQFKHGWAELYRADTEEQAIAYARALSRPVRNWREAF